MATHPNNYEPNGRSPSEAKQPPLAISRMKSQQSTAKAQTGTAGAGAPSTAACEEEDANHC